MMFTARQIRDFWSKARVSADDSCWEWTGARNTKGYGIKRIGAAGKKKNIMAHRMAWLLFNSTLPEGLLVCHRCDNPSCVNPAHLFLGTAKDNMDDKIAKGRGIDPPLAVLKFTPEQAADVRALSGLGASMRAIARKYNTSHSVVRRVILGEGRYDGEVN